ncbi:hypothetical protein SAMN05444365_103116 [Micromonospora pattaloongensis]|uniref:Uncharacterized protein n=1 Tax=Micromonospora pattaloongensis TaxID=405436 RepID=A0A1H3LWW1_9ACTN|nr:hypothetical protein [Micromonospora pattaloongensis]SDY68504.1 hypothetical protein SAMN05444365_103116 [Micromonospora pattaloongensis]
MLTTLEGHYLRSIVLDHYRVRRYLQSEGAAWDTMPFFGLVEAAFNTAVGQLGRTRLGPDQLERFADRAAASSRRFYSVTPDEASRVLRYELGEEVAVADLGGRLELAARVAVIATTVPHLRLTLHDLDNMLRKAELLAQQWGFDATPYYPGTLARLVLMLADARWTTARLRRGRHHLRPALPRHSRAR